MLFVFPEPPRKVVKKNGDEEDPGEKDNDPALCGTETGCKGSEDGDDEPGEDNPKSDSPESKEESRHDNPGVSKEDKKEEEAHTSNETETTDAAEDPEEEGKVSGLPPGVPSGWPSNALIDPAEAATVTNPNSVVEERAELDKELVGRVIGKGGEMIRDLQVSVLHILTR